MAENKNKNTNENGATNTNENGATNTAKPKAEKMVNVFIPKQNRGDTERFVAVNGERILVQTGKNVKVPERFAEVIKNSQEMAAVSEAYIDANISK